MKNKSGFTIIEILVVIAVIGILTTIGLVSFSRYQVDSRDTQRSTKTAILAEALEKYYDQNGEYPSCSTMTGSAATLTSTVLPNIEANVILTPKSTSGATNSISCAALTGAAGEPDSFAYVGDGSTDCASGAACLEWTLSYKEESTGTVKTISSRRTTQIATSGTMTVSAVTASDSQINLTWNAITNASSYQLQRSTTAGMASPVVTSYASSVVSASATGLNAGQIYYFRIAAVANSSQGAWSVIDSATTTIAQPSGTPTVATTLITSDTVARGTAASAGTCSTGATLEYQIRYHSTNVAADGAWSGWTVGATRDVGTWQGNKYTFQSQARCIGATISSAFKQSVTTNAVRSILTPSAPTWQITTEWAAGYNYKFPYGWSCPAGTNIGAEGVVSDGKSTPWYDWWYTGWNAGQYDIWHTYVANYRCQTTYGQTYSPNTSTQIHAYCDPGRRSFSASPRCDNAGQGQGGNGYAN